MITTFLVMGQPTKKVRASERASARLPLPPGEGMTVRDAKVRPALPHPPLSGRERGSMFADAISLDRFDPPLAALYHEHAVTTEIPRGGGVARQLAHDTLARRAQACDLGCERLIVVGRRPYPGRATR